jgi:hypothetical protein
LRSKPLAFHAIPDLHRGEHGEETKLTPEPFRTSWIALTYREALVAVPIGIMEKSATIMNYDLVRKSIEVSEDGLCKQI